MANERTEGPKTTRVAKRTSKPKKTSAPKKAPASKPSLKPEFGAKTAFIKAQPVSMTAKEVVAAAKAQGITLSENLVYAARASTKKKSTGAKKAKGASSKGTSKAKPGPKPKAKASKGGGSKVSGSLESTLRNAIAELGLAGLTPGVRGSHGCVPGLSALGLLERSRPYASSL
jgi:hypothetical protein